MNTRYLLALKLLILIIALSASTCYATVYQYDTDKGLVTIDNVNLKGTWTLSSPISGYSSINLTFDLPTSYSSFAGSIYPNDTDFSRIVTITNLQGNINHLSAPLSHQADFYIKKVSFGVDVQAFTIYIRLKSGEFWAYNGANSNNNDSLSGNRNNTYSYNESSSPGSSSSTATLTAAYRFEEAEWNGVSKEVTDYIGSNHGQSVNYAHVSAILPALIDSPGTCEYGYYHNANQDHVKIPYSSDLNHDGDFSIALWVRVAGGADTYRTVLSSRWVNSNLSIRKGFSIFAGSNNQWQFWTGTGADSWHNTQGDTVDSTSNVWTHIAVTFKATSPPENGVYTGIKTLYVNGTSYSSPGSYSPNTINSTFIGAVNGNSGDSVSNVYYLNGGVDELKFYHGVLSQSDVDFIRTQRHPCTQPPPNAAYHFEDTELINGVYHGWSGVPYEVLDYSGNLLHGQSKSLDSPPNSPDVYLNHNEAISGSPGTCGHGAFGSPQLQYIEIPYDSLLNPSGPFTVALWAKMSSSEGTNRFRSVYTNRTVGADGKNHKGFSIYANKDNEWAFWTGKINGFDRLTAPIVGQAGKVKVNTWQHITVTFQPTPEPGDAQKGVKKLYIDGVLIATNTNGHYTPSANSTLIGGGRNAIGNITADDFFVQGRIDEVRVYDRVLGVSAVNNVMQETHSCPPPSPIAAYRFEDVAWNGTPGEVIDYTGNNYHGSAKTNDANFANLLNNNEALTGNPGTCGYASFNSEHGQYIEVPYDSTLNPNNDFAVSAWVYPNGGENTGRTIFDNTWNNGTEFKGFKIFIGGDNKWRLLTNDNHVFTVDDAPLNQWSHIVVSYTVDSTSTTDGVTTHTGTVRIYINGVLAGLGNANGATTISNIQYTPNPENSTLIGAARAYNNTDPINKYFQGHIDEVKLFNNALNQYTVSALHQERHTCENYAPLGEWHFDEGSWNGTAYDVKDSSQYTNHATSVGAQPNGVGRALPGNPGTCNYGEFNDTEGDYVSLGNPTDFNFSGTISLMAWVRPDKSDGFRYIIAHGYRRDPNHELVLRINNNEYQIGAWDATTASTTTSAPIPAGDVDTNTWVHLAATYDGRVWRLYRNGEVIASQVSTLGAEDFEAEWAIGARGGGGSRYFDGGIDEVRIYRRILSRGEIVDVMNQRRPCKEVDHINISHSGNGINCTAENITFTIHNEDHDPANTSYTNTITVSTDTNKGDWSLITGGGVLNNGLLNNGQATYSFVNSDNRQVVLGLKHTEPGTVNIDVTDGNISESSGMATSATDDPAIVYSSSGFRFIDTISGYPSISTHISGKDSNVDSYSGAGDAQNLRLQAIKTDTTTGVCQAALTGRVNVELAFECIDPSTCGADAYARPLLARAHNSDTPVAIAANDSGSSLTYTSVPLNFGSASSNSSAFVFNYPDAGKIRLHARYNIPLGDDTELSGTLMTGSSNQFVVKPAGVCLEATEQNSTCTAGDHTCKAFKKAGEDFNFTIKAVTWGGSAENNDALCDNTITPNFIYENFNTKVNLIAPTSDDGGVTPTLQVPNLSIKAEDKGSKTYTTQTVSDVGVVSISTGTLDAITNTLEPITYLGVVDAINVSTSAYIGRFTPDHYKITTTSPITEACMAGDFTYMKDNFAINYKIRAENATNALTQNYLNGFIKLTTSDLNYGAISTTNPQTLTSRLTIDNALTSLNWSTGIGTLITSANLARKGIGLTNVDGPFALRVGVIPTDSDNITLLASDRNLPVDNDADTSDDFAYIGSSDQRYGRLVIDRATGAINDLLSLPVRTEYWQGSKFITNTNDNCSGSLFNIDGSDFTLEDADSTDDLTPALVVTATEPKTYTSISNGVGAVNLNKAPSKRGILNVLIDALELTEPDTPIPYRVPAYLRYDFNNDNIDDSPYAQAIYGQYRGNDRIIYWREK